MQNIINELIEFTANLTFMLVVIALTFLILTFFVECLCAGILLYLLKPLIKRL
jgi:predicted PurR-regulated permease PerM